MTAKDRSGRDALPFAPIELSTDISSPLMQIFKAGYIVRLLPYKPCCDTSRFNFCPWNSPFANKDHPQHLAQVMCQLLSFIGWCSGISLPRSRAWANKVIGVLTKRLFASLIVMRGIALPLTRNQCPGAASWFLNSLHFFAPFSRQLIQNEFVVTQCEALPGDIHLAAEAFARQALTSTLLTSSTTKQS